MATENTDPKAKAKKKWHHDIKFVNGQFVEKAVAEYQATKDPKALDEIMRNYSIFRNTWARTYAPYLDDGVEDGQSRFDEVVWKSAAKFKDKKKKKGNGYAFNAYFTSALMNTEKNFKGGKTSRKRNPSIPCPVCGQKVIQIDKEHLMHRVDLDKYIHLHPNYSLSSPDGKIKCPYDGKRVDELTLAYMNWTAGKYIVEDFQEQFGPVLPRGPFVCPMTGQKMQKVDAVYPTTLAPGYTEEDFIKDFPDFPGLIRSPFSGQKMLAMSQDHLDIYVNKKKNKRLTMSAFRRDHPYATMKAKQIKVFNPYTKKRVPEITLDMLKQAGVTLKEHVEKYATIVLGRRYDQAIHCPFTGRKVHKITLQDLEKLGKTPMEFYLAVCRYPLRKFKVRCAICGKWVENIWTHLEERVHNYSDPMTIEQYEQTFGNVTRNYVLLRSFMESDDDEKEKSRSSDLAVVDDTYVKKSQESMDLEATLLKFAENEEDKRLARATNGAKTVEDIVSRIAQTKSIFLKRGYNGEKRSELKLRVRNLVDVSDFDIERLPSIGEKRVAISTPSKDTVCERLKYLSRKAGIAPV